MDTLLTEIIARALMQDGSAPSQRRHRASEDTNSDLYSFIRPGESIDQNIQLLELIRSIESDRHTYDVRRRQLRIASDMMEDYQYNMQLFIQYISANMQNPDNRPIATPTTTPTATPRAVPSTRQRPMPTAPITRTGLTDRQVELGTRTVLYDTSMNETRCPISLDEFVEGEEISQINGCGHVFKCSPLREWFRRNTHCPVCRYNLTTSSGRVRAAMSDVIRRNTFVNGNTGVTSSSVRDRGNSQATSDSWTTLLSGLITAPTSGATYTFNREFVIPLQFDTEDGDGNI